MIGINLSDFSYRGFISGREYRPFDSVAKRVSLVALSVMAAIASLLLLPPLFGIILGGGFAALAFALSNGEKTPPVYTARSVGPTIQIPLRSPTSPRHVSVGTRDRRSSSVVYPTVYTSPVRSATSNSMPGSHHVQVGEHSNRSSNPSNHTSHFTNLRAPKTPSHVSVGTRDQRSSSNSTNHHSFISDFITQSPFGQNPGTQHVQVGEGANRSSRFSNLFHRT